MRTVNDGANALTWLMSDVITLETGAQLWARGGLDRSCRSV